VHQAFLVHYLLTSFKSSYYDQQRYTWLVKYWERVGHKAMDATIVEAM
jgi:hypothetical protein